MHIILTYKNDKVWVWIWLKACSEYNFFFCSTIGKIWLLSVFRNCVYSLQTVNLPTVHKSVALANSTCTGHWSLITWLDFVSSRLTSKLCLYSQDFNTEVKSQCPPMQTIPTLFCSILYTVQYKYSISKYCIGTDIDIQT